MAKQAIFVLASGTVIDRSVLITLPSAGVELISLQARMGPLPLVVVDTAESFFNGPNMIALIKAGDPKCKLIADKFNFKLDEHAVAHIRHAVEIENEIIKAATLPAPPYPFVAVPDGWTTATHLSIGPTKIIRKKTNKEGDTAAYFLSPDQVKKVWSLASNRWFSGKYASVHDSSLVKDYTNRSIRVYSDRVTVGCQTIRRYELEQLAKHKDWQFPVVEAK